MHTPVIAPAPSSALSDVRYRLGTSVRPERISDILEGLIEVLEDFSSDFREEPQSETIGEQLCDLLYCLYGYTEQIECRIAEYQQTDMPTEGPPSEPHVAPNCSSTDRESEHRRIDAANRQTHPNTQPERESSGNSIVERPMPQDATEQARSEARVVENASAYPDIDKLEHYVRELADGCFRTLTWLSRPSEHVLSKGAMAHLINASDGVVSTLSHPLFEAATILRANRVRIENEKTT